MAIKPGSKRSLQMKVYCQPELAKACKMEALERGISYSEFVERCIIRELAKKPLARPKLLSDIIKLPSHLTKVK